MNSEIDVRHVLAAIRVPTLVAPPRRGDRIRHAARRALARRAHPGRAATSSSRATTTCRGSATRTPIARRDRGVPDRDAAQALEAEPDRVLATVLFTDIVGSTEQRRGARRPRAGGSCSSSTTRWCGASSTRFRGREVDTAGDGFLATLRRPGARDPLRVRRSPRRCARSASRSAPGCTPASASDRRQGRRDRRPHRRAGRGAGRRRARCSSPAPSRISSPAPGSRSPTAARTSSRECPASGACSRSSACPDGLRSLRKPVLRDGRDDLVAQVF